MHGRAIHTGFTYSKSVFIRSICYRGKYCNISLFANINIHLQILKSYLQTFEISTLLSYQDAGQNDLENE